MLKLNSAFNSAKRNFIKQHENDIRTHEMAHKRAGGKYAGPVVIERDSDGMPTGGHVDIKMPSLNPDDPKGTIEHAKTIINSALAPSDPSNQDLKVASEAKKVLLQAQKLKLENHKLDYFA